MANELIQASLSSLAPHERAIRFRQIMTRAAEVASIRSIHHLVPDPLDGFLLSTIEAMERRMEPAGKEVAKQALSLACQILRCKRPEGEALAGYIAVLAEFPRDLLMPSIKQALAKETHHVLPAPGALLADARPRREERQRAISQAKAALKRLQVADEWRKRGLIPGLRE